MKVDIQDLLKSTGSNEALYPGKKMVRKYQQPGEYKSHCVVFDWHDPKTLHVELKAGLSGHTLDNKELHHYPVSFQAATYLDIATVNDNSAHAEDEEEDEDEETGAQGKSGGGGKKPARRRDRDDVETSVSLRSFGRIADGRIPSVGDIQKFVVMGKELAKEAYAQAYENLKTQLAQTKIMAIDLMKGVSNIIQKATPGGGLTAKGDETLKYRYDAEKTAPMFGGLTPG